MLNRPRVAQTFDGTRYAPGARFRVLAPCRLSGFTPARGGADGWSQTLAPGDVITCTGFGAGWGSDPGFGVEFTSDAALAARAYHCDLSPSVGGVWGYRPRPGLLEPLPADPLTVPRDTLVADEAAAAGRAADRPRPGHRHPYVGSGADGARRSAEVDRAEAHTLDRTDPRYAQLLERAADWDAQAAELEAGELEAGEAAGRAEVARRRAVPCPACIAGYPCPDHGA